MTTTFAPTKTVTLITHAGSMTHPTAITTDGTDDIIIGADFTGLDPAISGMRLIVKNPVGVEKGRDEITGGVAGTASLAIALGQGVFADDGSFGYGTWSANLSVMEPTTKWVYDRSFKFTVTYKSSTTPPPPPPPDPDPVPDPDPNPPPPDPVPDPVPLTLWQKIKARFPTQLQPYAAPIIVGAGLVIFKKV